MQEVTAFSYQYLNTASIKASKNEREIHKYSVYLLSCAVCLFVQTLQQT